jgi:hypothetical protein
MDKTVLKKKVSINEGNQKVTRNHPMKGSRKSSRNNSIDSILTDEDPEFNDHNFLKPNGYKNTSQPPRDQRVKNQQTPSSMVYENKTYLGSKKFGQ